MATTRAQQLDVLHEQVRSCTKCSLHTSRTNAVPGDGGVSARAMLVGEAPGEEEDAQGHAFVGSAGRYLDRVLDEVGLDRDAFFITNVVKCRPPDNRTPERGEIDTCVAAYLQEQIDLVQPEVVVLLGTTAAGALLEEFDSIKQARSEVIEQDGRRYLVGYHPAARFYREDLGDAILQDFEQLKKVLEE